MPLFSEGRSRKAWRRQVADSLVERLDADEELRFVGSTPEDRKEMLKIAELLPHDVIAELYEDPSYPGHTFMEIRLTPEPVKMKSSLRIVYPDGRSEEAV